MSEDKALRCARKLLEGSDLLWVTLDPPQNTAFCDRGFGDRGRKTLWSGSVSVAQVTHSGTRESHLETSGPQSYLWFIKEADSGALRFPSKCIGFKGTQDQGYRVRTEHLSHACMFYAKFLSPHKMLPFIKGEQSHYFGYYEIAFICKFKFMTILCHCKEYFFLLPHISHDRLD